MRHANINTAQLAFIEQHPEMVRGYQEPSEKKDECKCEKPEFAFEKPSLKTDGTYFNYCKLCCKFRDVPKPERILVF
jgi:hypothetical protein